MSRRKRLAHPPRDRFLAELIALHTECGRPRYSRIVALSPRLKELYGLDRMITFSKSTLSENFKGLRQTLPEPLWVTCFVLCCQRIAFEDNVLLADPGLDSVQRWQRLLAEANDEAQKLGLPVRGGPRTAPRNTHRSTDQVPPEVLFGAVADHCGTVTGPIHLTDEQREHLAEYGRYGRALQERARARDPHAIHQIALLLAADLSRGYEIRPLLIAADLSPRALALLQASPEQLDRRHAEADAHELSRLAQAAGLTDAAAAFAACAARFNSASAAVRATAIATDE